MTTEMRVADVVFREDLYPRIKTDPMTVQKYAEDLDVLPPIEVNQRNELVDGWHRWTAHKKIGVEGIRCTVVQTESDAHLLELAIERNASHGLQLRQDDKQKMARRIYESFLSGSQAEREEKKKHLAKILSVGISTVHSWLSRMDKDAKAELRVRAFDMWMACHTQQEIASAIGYSQPVVAEFIKSSIFIGNSKDGISDKTRGYKPTGEGEGESGDDTAGLGRIVLTKPQIASAEYADEGFSAPIYNVWKQQEKTTGASHFGNSEVRWVDNLLYLYTQPFDVIVDPFAGGGSTIDLCKKRFRRYWASDRKPIVEREKEIRAHDLTVGVPGLPGWKDVALVYLDPPYWKQAEGKYSADPTDLANMDLEKFNETLAGIIRGFAGKMKSAAREAPAYIALLIQPTQWKAPEKQFTDHVGDMLRAIKLPVDMRFSAPYESQQCTSQMVDWAKENKRCLVLTRELVVWRVGA